MPPPIEVAVERFAPKDIDVLIMEPGEALELAAE